MRTNTTANTEEKDCRPKFSDCKYHSKHRRKDHRTKSVIANITPNIEEKDCRPKISDCKYQTKYRRKRLSTQNQRLQLSHQTPKKKTEDPKAVIANIAANTEEKTIDQKSVIANITANTEEKTIDPKSVSDCKYHSKHRRKDHRPKISQ